MLKTPQIALVYDWVTTKHGGAEQVLLALHEAFPAAPLFTSVYDPKVADWAAVFKINTSFLQRFSWFRQHHRWLVPLLPIAFETLDLDAFDVVISITSAEAKGVLTKPNQLHISYMLTPTRYLYSHKLEYLGSVSRWFGFRRLVSWILEYLQWWDLVAATRPDHLIPISKRVAERVKHHYGRPVSPVIYPPYQPLQPNSKAATEALSRFNLRQGEYCLVVSRLVSYKRIDLALSACHELHKKLVIVGDGPQRDELTQLATQSASGEILFVGTQAESVVRSLMGGCSCLLMPGEEDFGITALETASTGRPVVLHSKSGVAEILADGVAAVHIPEATKAAVVAALQRLDTITWNRKKIERSVTEYTVTHFTAKITQSCLKLWQQFERKV